MELIFERVNTEEQIAEVARLADKIWHEHYRSIITIEQIDYMIDKYQSAPAIREQMDQQGYEYYLFRLEDTLSIGYMSVKQEEGKLFLSKFYIDKEHRGQGYASLAITFLERLCLDRSLTHIWLTVNRDNVTSIAVYEKKGFRIVKVQVADIGNGFVMDDFVMERAVQSQ